MKVSDSRIWSRARVGKYINADICYSLLRLVVVITTPVIYALHCLLERAMYFLEYCDKMYVQGGLRVVNLSHKVFKESFADWVTCCQFLCVFLDDFGGRHDDVINGFPRVLKSGKSSPLN
jgi:hypothetical protein